MVKFSDRLNNGWNTGKNARVNVENFIGKAVQMVNSFILKAVPIV
jgi:hypothetical protein